MKEYISHFVAESGRADQFFINHSGRLDNQFNGFVEDNAPVKFDTVPWVVETVQTLVFLGLTVISVNATFTFLTHFDRIRFSPHKL